MTVILKGKAVADVKKMGVEKCAPSSTKTAAKKKTEVKKEAEKDEYAELMREVGDDAGTES